MERTVLRIEGMTCGHCVKAVTDALSRVPGVQEARVDLGLQRAVVGSSGPLDLGAAARAVEEEGYKLVQ